MCNLYTYKLSADEMRGLMSHYRLIGTTWTERMRSQNEPINDVYPNRPAPVVVEHDAACVCAAVLAVSGFSVEGGL